MLVVGSCVLAGVFAGSNPSKTHTGPATGGSSDDGVKRLKDECDEEEVKALRKIFDQLYTDDAIHVALRKKNLPEELILEIMKHRKAAQKGMVRTIKKLEDRDVPLSGPCSDLVKKLHEVNKHTGP